MLTLTGSTFKGLYWVKSRLSSSKKRKVKREGSCHRSSPYTNTQRKTETFKYVCKTFLHLVKLYRHSLIREYSVSISLQHLFTLNISHCGIIILCTLLMFWSWQMCCFHIFTLQDTECISASLCRSHIRQKTSPPMFQPDPLISHLSVPEMHECREAYRWMFWYVLFIGTLNKHI